MPAGGNTSHIKVEFAILTSVSRAGEKSECSVWGVKPHNYCIFTRLSNKSNRGPTWRRNKRRGSLKMSSVRAVSHCSCKPIANKAWVRVCFLSFCHFFLTVWVDSQIKHTCISKRPRKKKCFLRKGGSVELDFKQKLSTLRIPKGLFFSASPNCFSPAQIDRTVYKSVAFFSPCHKR